MNELFRSEDTNNEDREPAPQEIRADTTSEPLADPDHALSLMELFDAGLGPQLVSVIPPGSLISPNSNIKPEATGKIPGRLTPAGWVGVNLNDPRSRCGDRATAKLWMEVWRANAGLCMGNGIVALDNDQGEVLNQIVTRICLEILDQRVELLRRFVRDPKHRRSAFLFRVLDFIGDPVSVGNQTLKFECTGTTAELQVLAQRKQLVVSGVHPGTGAAYVLNRRVSSLADIPVVTLQQFDRIIEGATAAMKAIGWALVSKRRG